MTVSVLFPLTSTASGGSVCAASFTIAKPGECDHCVSLVSLNLYSQLSVVVLYLCSLAQPGECGDCFSIFFSSTTRRT